MYIYIEQLAVMSFMFKELITLYSRELLRIMTDLSSLVIAVG